MRQAAVALSFIALLPVVLGGGCETLDEQPGTIRVEAPAETLGPLLSALARLYAIPQMPTMRGSWCTLAGDIPAACVHTLRLELPALSRGEGVLECAFDRYEPVSGTIPSRPRSDDNPLNREEYLLRVAGRVKGRGAARARS